MSEFQLGLITGVLCCAPTLVMYAITLWEGK